MRVEIIRRREPQRGDFNPRNIRVLGNRRQVARRTLGRRHARDFRHVAIEITRPTTRGHRSLHARVDTSHHGGQAAAHGMARHAKLRRIDLGLVLQERQPAPRAEAHDEPVVIAHGINRIEGERIRRRPDCEVVGLVALRRVRGVERAPIGIRSVVDLAIGQGHLVTAPVEGQRCVAQLRVRRHRG